VYLAAQPAGKRVLNRDMAARLGVPAAYLAKIMQDLSKANLVRSFRGQQGGFCLEDGAEGMSLIEIVSLIEGGGFGRACVLGLHVCDEGKPCPIHGQWRPIKRSITRAWGRAGWAPSPRACAAAGAGSPIRPSPASWDSGDRGRSPSVGLVANPTIRRPVAFPPFPFCAADSVQLIENQTKKFLSTLWHGAC
jgi:Rrf2 family protein